MRESAAETILQALTDAELTCLIGAAPGERSSAATTQRNAGPGLSRPGFGQP